jgi:hypothetical protein
MAAEASGDSGTIPQRKSAGSQRRADRKIYGRSRITNGRDLLPEIDGRCLIARRYRDIAGAILVDQGGADACSEARQQLIRRFAAAAVLAEQMEGALARGEKVDVAEHALLASTLVRIAQRIGLDRRAKNVTPSLRDYLEAKTVATEAAG